MISDATAVERPPITALSRAQRRVLGVLVEKAITVPESYPLTLKALASGCNQKNNREPVTNYTEDDVHDTLDELRAMGLAAVVHTESGRTERFRHYLRQRIADLSEPQVAILTELLLRGRQPAGDLRSRASRMAPAGSLESLDQLRHELTGLLERRLIQSDGPLDRRGVEVDHNLYEPHEDRTISPRPASEEGLVAAKPAPATPGVSAAGGATISPGGSSEISGRLAALEAAHAAMRLAVEEREGTIESLQKEVAGLADELRRLRDALGA
ncbi:MAG: DUF480 domain-containing protein [Planctomycetaceae bacterium]